MNELDRLKKKLEKKNIELKKKDDRHRDLDYQIRDLKNQLNQAARICNVHIEACNKIQAENFRLQEQYDNEIQPLIKKCSELRKTKEFFRKRFISTRDKLILLQESLGK